MKKENPELCIVHSQDSLIERLSLTERVNASKTECPRGTNVLESMRNAPVAQLDRASAF